MELRRMFDMRIGRGDLGWFVGAYWSGHDQTDRFIRDGIWVNGYDDRYLDQVRAMRTGDGIAIKKSYTRIHGVPFNSRGKYVSVMAVVAVGEIRNNPGDGRRVEVDWKQRFRPIREWYFFTFRATVWRVRVRPHSWENKELLDFTFDGKDQDIPRFLKVPYWGNRYSL